MLSSILISLTDLANILQRFLISPPYQFWLIIIKQEYPLISADKKCHKKMKFLSPETKLSEAILYYFIIFSEENV